MNKSMKPTKPARQVEPTEEEKKQHALRFLAQKQGSLFEGILACLCQNPSVDLNTVTDKAMEIAQKAMEKLYPMPKDDPNRN